MPSPWFTVDQKGLARKLSRKGKEFALFELVQNAWDAPGVTTIKVSCTHKAGYMQLTVEDDSPAGFVNLDHAYTLFAPSIKETDPEKRGRFNAGEKFVFAISRTASVTTTTGTIKFGPAGRQHSKAKTERGTIVSCSIVASKDEFNEILLASKLLLVPKGIRFEVNGELMPSQASCITVPAKLRTEILNEHGILKQVERDTTVALHEGAPAYLYELGIPVMKISDRWSYNVGQKVPLTMDREAVTPAFLKSIRLAVVNSCYLELTQEDCNHTWVHEAVEDARCSKAAVAHYMDTRFSKKRVSFDPTDPEANKIAVSQGYTVVYGNMLSGEAWHQVKAAEAIKPAGQVTPSPKPFTPGAPPYKLMNNPTDEMLRVCEYSKNLGYLLLGCRIQVILANDPGWFPCAVYGPSGDLILNVGRLGYKWFALDNVVSARERINKLLIHEWGHHYSLDHLSSEYHEALCGLGAKLCEVAATGAVPKL